ncbi:MAG: hypothetical protein KBD01_07920 [Acidobacteria bacterium]|nr:hypothetical protein [Acidobacteriota bacterium]
MRRSAALALVLLLAAGAAAAEPLQFTLTGKYQVRVGDKVDPAARVYRSAGVPRLLVVSSMLPAAALITAGEKTAAKVDPAAVQAADDDPEAVRLDTAVATAPSAITIDGTRLKFRFGGSPVAIEPREAMLGDLDPERLLQQLPEYRRAADEYGPGRGDMRLLGSMDQPVDVDVFFGTWCPHCEKYVPRLIRVARDLQNPNIKFHFHGVPERITDDPLARQRGVDAVPTALVRRGDDVLGKIEGEAWTRPEAALSATVFGGESTGRSGDR